jgi:hypothetical protein
MPRVKYLSAKVKDLYKTEFGNFSVTGSIAGMKKKVYGKDALLVRQGQYIYNVDQATYDMAH